MKKNYLIAGILLTLTIIFACLRSVWAGFVFFALSIFAVLCLYLAVIFIIKYLEDYKWHFEEDFAFYKASIINSSNLTEEDFEAGKAVYIKKFKKTLLRDKFIDIFKIIFCISLAITCVVAMSSGVLR